MYLPPPANSALSCSVFFKISPKPSGCQEALQRGCSQVFLLYIRPIGFAPSLKTTKRDTFRLHVEGVKAVVIRTRPSSKLGVKYFFQDEGPKTPVSVPVCLVPALTNGRPKANSMGTFTGREGPYLVDLRDRPRDHGPHTILHRPSMQHESFSKIGSILKEIGTYLQLHISALSKRLQLIILFTGLTCRKPLLLLQNRFPFCGNNPQGPPQFP